MAPAAPLRFPSGLGRDAWSCSMERNRWRSRSTTSLRCASPRHWWPPPAAVPQKRASRDLSAAEWRGWQAMPAEEATATRLPENVGPPPSDWPSCHSGTPPGALDQASVPTASVLATPFVKQVERRLQLFLVDGGGDAQVRGKAALVARSSPYRTRLALCRPTPRAPAGVAPFPPDEDEPLRAAAAAGPPAPLGTPAMLAPGMKKDTRCLCCLPLAGAPPDGKFLVETGGGRTVPGGVVREAEVQIPGLLGPGGDRGGACCRFADVICRREPGAYVGERAGRLARGPGRMALVRPSLEGLVPRIHQEGGSHARVAPRALSHVGEGRLHVAGPQRAH